MSSTTERRFLVREQAFPAGARQDGVHHERGFLSLDPPIRVRAFESDVDGRRGYSQAERDEPPFAPGERERRIEHYVAQELLAKCEGSVLQFTRYRAKVGAHLWHVDAFEAPHEGLWLATVELDADDEPFEKPLWLDREVTHDALYSEAELARAGKRPA